MRDEKYMEELKRCPFCGGEAMEIEPDEVGSHWFRYWRIKCTDCGAMTAGTHRRMNREVWNRRSDRSDCTCRNVGGEDWGFMCSECGGYTHGSPFHPPVEVQDGLAALMGGRIISLHGSVPKYCPYCGKMVIS